MEFASATFLFIFLPAVFLLYAVLPWDKVRNGLLIAASLVFYAWGEPLYVLLMALSAAVNYFAARLIDGRAGEGGRKKLATVLAVVFNIGLLAVFKYSAFAVRTVNSIFSASLPVPADANPLGISFFTFQALGYVLDVSNGKFLAERNFARFLLFISFFAQLLQGPILRYDEIKDRLEHRELSVTSAAEGLRLFIIGLAMKLVVANTLGRVTSFVFALDKASLNAAYAWAGAVCFLFQIYFDFAGYSQMAIGLGMMFGFDIPRNFNYPYIAYSMTDFWRRWHITLSRWFRDHVYIPLGGNRRGAPRTGINKIIVFLLTGLWHGANWTFVVWGAYNGAFLLGENYIKKTKLRLPKPVTWVYTILAVTVGFVIFNSPDMPYACAMIKAMFSGFSVGRETAAELSKVFSPLVTVTLAAAAVAATPAAKLLCEKLSSRPKLQFALRYGFALVLFAVCVFYIALGNYNPSIYTKF